MWRETFTDCTWPHVLRINESLNEWTHYLVDICINVLKNKGCKVATFISMWGHESDMNIMWDQKIQSDTSSMSYSRSISKTTSSSSSLLDLLTLCVFECRRDQSGAPTSTSRASVSHLQYFKRHLKAPRERLSIWILKLHPPTPTPTPTPTLSTTNPHPRRAPDTSEASESRAEDAHATLAVQEPALF